jgi:mannose-P-dolichol utilization defect protein 1
MCFEYGGADMVLSQVFNYLLGSLTRIFTTLQEVDDKLILYGFIAGFALNAVLALQMVYYWNAPSAKVKGKQKEAPVPASSTSTARASTPTPKSKGPTTRRRG